MRKSLIRHPWITAIYRNQSTTQSYHENPDPLLYPSLKIDHNIIPNFKSGSDVLKKLDKMIDDNKLIDSVMAGPKPIIGYFDKVFPEVANNIGHLKHTSWSHWDKGQNDVTMSLDPEPHLADINPKDVYVGGPASLVSAAIQACSGEQANKVLYAHDGMRDLSNWKGSASYFHVRDCIPVYYWPDNHGAYVLWATFAHKMMRLFKPNKYKEQVATDPNWNKLRLNIPGLLREPETMLLFMKNAFRSYKDLGLRMDRPIPTKPENTTAWTTTDHAFLSHEILKQLPTPYPVIMKNNKRSRALHLHLGDSGLEETNDVFRHLEHVAGDKISNHKLSKQQLADRGYDTNVVKQALEFTQDGYFPTYVDGMLENMVKERGGHIKDNWKLKKILVAKQGEKDIRITRAVFKNMCTGKEETQSIKSLYLSLGPSMRKLNIISEYSNKVKNILQHIMWASGSSIVLLVQIDKDKVPDHKMIKFRDHIDAHNKHLVRLGEREVVTDDKKYQVFALRTTGGGHFPVKHAHAETAVNVIQANIVPMLGLNSDDGIKWDVVSLRSCARGLSAQNVFRITAPASNMVMMYGIGGIGMTTMAPNALLMKAVMGARKQLSLGQITNSQFSEILRTSNFGNKIPHWKYANPFSRNYAQFMDNVRNPQVLAKYFNRQQKEISLSEGDFNMS